MPEALPAEYQLLATAATVSFDVGETSMEPINDGDDTRVVIELLLGELDEDEQRSEDVEWGALGFMFTLALLSFHDARPRGVSEMDFAEKDVFGVEDLLAHLRFERGTLRLATDFLRGRCMKTTIAVHADGRVQLETLARGESALRWVAQLKGEKPLQLVR